MNLSIRSQLQQRIPIFLMVMAIVMSMPGVSITTALAASSSSHTVPGAQSIYLQGKHFSFYQGGVTPPSDAFCRAKFGTPCYSPQEIRRAYGLQDLIHDGFAGFGQSIVIIDSFGSPTIASDLRAFDAAYGLPDPPSLRVIAPLGTVPFDPSNSDMVNWAFETTLDVEWSHAIAPGAKIVLLTSPISETEGVQGMPQFLALEKYALDHQLGKIISQSWGATENTLFTPGGQDVFADFESFYKQVAAENVTVFASTGDSGSSNIDVNKNTYPFPTVIFPASSPWVTAVGGTSLFADTNGKYQSGTVWNNSIGAGGGGISQEFSIPDYQENNLGSGIQDQLNGHRGIPDISYNADPNTTILVYLSFLPQVGFYGIGGTSEGSPQWAGIIAIADQVAGHPLGFLNRALYQLGHSDARNEVFHDITVGNNAFGGVPGYDATPGWDLASGWGTPSGANLIEALVELKGSGG